MKLSDLFKPPGVSAARLRMEIFALGGRHQGDPLAGALRELQASGLDDERRSLLRAVVAHLGDGDAKATARADQGSRRSRPAGFSDVVYIAVILAAAIWTGVVISSLGAG